MGEYYSHFLIPERSNFAPSAAQIVAFLSALEKIGGAPLNTSVALSKPSGRTRVFRSPTTGEEIAFPRRENVKCETLGAVEPGLQGSEDYSVIFSGQGPPQLPPFPLFAASDSRWRSEFASSYAYEVSCNLRPTGLSFSESSWHKPCDSVGGDGIVSNPWNRDTIRVPNGGCARFWIKFHFGKFLVPRIEERLDLLAPEIRDLAIERFGVPFTQSCFFG